MSLIEGKLSGITTGSREGTLKFTLNIEEFVSNTIGFSDEQMNEYMSIMFRSMMVKAIDNIVQPKWNDLYIMPHHSPSMWPEWLYCLIRIEWLNPWDGKNLWMASPHTRYYPDFKPDIDDKKSYIMWSLRQIPIELSLTNREKYVLAHHYQSRNLMFTVANYSKVVNNYIKRFEKGKYMKFF